MTDATLGRNGFPETMNRLALICHRVDCAEVRSRSKILLFALCSAPCRGNLASGGKSSVELPGRLVGLFGAFYRQFAKTLLRSLCQEGKKLRSVEFHWAARELEVTRSGQIVVDPGTFLRFVLPSAVSAGNERCRGAVSYGVHI